MPLAGRGARPPAARRARGGRRSRLPCTLPPAHVGGWLRARRPTLPRRPGARSSAGADRGLHARRVRRSPQLPRGRRAGASCADFISVAILCLPAGARAWAASAAASVSARTALRTRRRGPPRLFAHTSPGGDTLVDAPRRRRRRRHGGGRSSTSPGAPGASERPAASTGVARSSGTGPLLKPTIASSASASPRGTERRRRRRYLHSVRAKGAPVTARVTRASRVAWRDNRSSIASNGSSSSCCTARCRSRRRSIAGDVRR